jgi:adenylate cyclase class 2
MRIEIEAKLKVDSHEQVSVKLSKLGAEFLGEQLQRDYYFDDTGSTLSRTDRALRLRRQSAGGREKFILTYKGAREKGQLKTRQEIEIEVADGDTTCKLLSAIGYETTLTFEKKRRLWKLGGCSIALDELPLLGCFVEIEGPDEKKITDVQRKLGLGELLHITESYAHLMAAKIQQLGSGKKEVFF